MAFMSFREPNQVKWVGVRPAHNGEQYNLYSQANNNTVILHTVSAGKTFFLTACSLRGNYVVSGWGALSVFDDVAALKYRILGVTNYVNTTPQSVSLSLFYPIEIPGNWSIRVRSSAASYTVDAFISGWEE